MPVSERPMLPTSFITDHRRRRVFAGLEAAAAKSSYRDVSVADIISEAKIARQSFYDIFDGKEDCALQTIVNGIVEAAERMNAAAAAADEGEQVGAAISALVRFIDDEPERARFFLVDGRSTKGLAARHEAGVRRFGEMLRAAMPSDVPHLHEMLVGGVEGILYQRVLAGESCVEIEDQLRDFILAPQFAAGT